MEVRTCPGPAVWQRYALGQVEEAEQHTLEVHLALCPSCLARLSRVRDEDTLLSDLRAGLTFADEPPDPAVDHVISRAVGFSGGAHQTISIRRSDLAEILIPPSSAGEIGRLAQFRVLGELGRGGMGIVFLAEDADLQRRVALKVLRPDFRHRPDVAVRFLREARAAAALRHDHVVTIYQVGEADGPDGPVPFLAMELLEGGSLETTLAQRPPPLPEAVRIAREVTEGLVAAHRSGVIHRDVKPDNIWLEGKARRAKLLDFGLARSVTGDSSLTAYGVIVGTPAYMAPEQAAGRAVDGRADLFGLGCVLYRLCTGRSAFPTADVMSTLTALATREPTPARRLNPAVPQALADLIHRLLAKSPDDRPADAEAVVVALREIEEDRSPSSRRAFVWNRRRMILAGLTGLAIMFVCLARPWAGRNPGGTGGDVTQDEDSSPSWAVGPGDGDGFTTAWREDFENTKAGQFPATWLRMNNAWEKGNGVEVGGAAQGERSLRLIGSVEKVFSGEVLIPLQPRLPFTLRYWIRQGDELLRPGVTHRVRGFVGFGPLSAPADELAACWVYAEGRMGIGSWSLPLKASRWREVTVRCDRVGAEVMLTTWVDGAFVGQSLRPLAGMQEPCSIRLTASCGSLWFDDVRLLYDPDTPADHAVTAAWLAIWRKAPDESGSAHAQCARAFAAQYRAAPTRRHRELGQAAGVQTPD